ncbi:MAG: 3-methylitaconate isomerase [Acidobacteria bacterium]|nr:3-methylitaconate isomerase [Acidobacteriota bacterium]
MTHKSIATEPATEPEIAVPCALYRGGTSRGLVFLEEHLPDGRDARSALLLRAFGSPDTRQIDGVGGATSLTSKAMIVGAETAPDADVRMLFAQVGVAVPTVDWGGNCGNMTSAVGPFAIESGLVPPVEPVTTVRIRSVNTGSLVHAHVPVRGGRVLTGGDCAIAGVPGTGAGIDLEWLEPGGSTTGRLLPTGRMRDRFVLSDRREIEVSIVDAANPMVFCAAESIGLTGIESPSELEATQHAMRWLEEIRSIAAEVLAIVPDRAVATRLSPGLPKVAFVAPPRAYRTASGESRAADTHDFHARYLSMQTAHRSYAAAGSICTAVAARLPGTIVHACATAAPAEQADVVRFAHPAGVMTIKIRMRGAGTEMQPESATVQRTARRIMSGAVWVPATLAGTTSRPGH